jgi:hypothetical protein
MVIESVNQFRVTRNSELFVDEEEVENLAHALKDELASRGFRRAVRLEIAGNQLVLEAGLEDRWLLATLPEPEARAAAEAFATARRQCCGLQFIAVQAAEAEPRLEGFWILRDLPDG